MLFGVPSLLKSQLKIFIMIQSVSRQVSQNGLGRSLNLFQITAQNLIITESLSTISTGQSTIIQPVRAQVLCIDFNGLSDKLFEISEGYWESRNMISECFSQNTSQSVLNTVRDVLQDQFGERILSQLLKIGIPPMVLFDNVLEIKKEMKGEKKQFEAFLSILRNRGKISAAGLMTLYVNQILADDDEKQILVFIAGFDLVILGQQQINPIQLDILWKKYHNRIFFESGDVMRLKLNEENSFDTEMEFMKEISSQIQFIPVQENPKRIGKQILELYLDYQKQNRKLINESKQNSNPIFQLIHQISSFTPKRVLQVLVLSAQAQHQQTKMLQCQVGQSQYNQIIRIDLSGADKVFFTNLDETKFRRNDLVLEVQGSKSISLSHIKTLGQMIQVLLRPQDILEMELTLSSDAELQIQSNHKYQSENNQIILKIQRMSQLVVFKIIPRANQPNISITFEAFIARQTKDKKIKIKGEQKFTTTPWFNIQNLHLQLLFYQLDSLETSLRKEFRPIVDGLIAQFQMYDDYGYQREKPGESEVLISYLYKLQNRIKEKYTCSNDPEVMSNINSKPNSRQPNLRFDVEAGTDSE